MADNGELTEETLQKVTNVITDELERMLDEKLDARMAALKAPDVTVNPKFNPKFEPKFEPKLTLPEAKPAPIINKFEAKIPKQEKPNVTVNITGQEELTKALDRLSGLLEKFFERDDKRKITTIKERDREGRIKRFEETKV